MKYLAKLCVNLLPSLIQWEYSNFEYKLKNAMASWISSSTEAIVLPPAFKDSMINSVAFKNSFTYIFLFPVRTPVPELLQLLRFQLAEVLGRSIASISIVSCPPVDSQKKFLKYIYIYISPTIQNFTHPDLLMIKLTKVRQYVQTSKVKKNSH